MSHKPPSSHPWYTSGWEGVYKTEQGERDKLLVLIHRVREGDKKAIRKLKKDRRARIYTKEEIHRLF